MIVYGEGGFDKQPKVIDGDGTVNWCNLCVVISYWSATEGLPDEILSDCRHRLIPRQVIGLC